MFKAIMIEIQHSITKTFFHLLRFGGLLIIPLIYGFSYIYAFYDPFTKVDQAKISVVTNKLDSAGKPDILSEALGKQLSKSNTIQMGDINMTMKMDHIYKEDVDIDKVKTDSYATLQIGDMSAINTILITALNGVTITNGVPQMDLLAKGVLAANILGALIKSSSNPNPLINFELNYKKSYLLAFGIDQGASMYSTIQFVERQILQAIQDPNYLSKIAPLVTNLSTTQIIGLLKGIETIGVSNINPIKVEAHMGEHAKYGYGLAPFFISVAMWIGGMVMTFAVHRKIYDKEITAGTRYFAKWFLMAFGVIAQASILMLALYFIGFDKLGIDHWGMIYGGAVVSGLIFMSIIQAIRFSIHNRALGILITIMLLVLQMASGGGLFPIETQSEFYKVANQIVPMGRSVNILRELSFNTDWSNVFIQFGYLAIWLYIIPVGVYINHRRTINIYREQNWKLPPKMAYRENIRIMRRGGK